MEPLSSNYTNNIHPAHTLWGELKRIISQWKTVFTQKTKLISILILILLWTSSSLLSIWNVSIPFLDFITFSKAGIHNGILGAIGGSIGKGFIAYFIVTIVQAIIAKQSPFNSLTAGIKSFFSVFRNSEKTPWYLFLVGIGFSMIIFNFLTGYATSVNGLVGIVGFILTAQAITKTNGFLHSFSSSICNCIQTKYMKKKSLLIDLPKTLMSGWGIGFGLAFAFSLSNQLFICYYIGVVALISSIPLYFIMENGGKK